jgi:hypothetical protein
VPVPETSRSLVEKLRDLAIDHAVLGEIRALAVHGDRIAVGGSLGYQLIAP